MDDPLAQVEAKRKNPKSMSRKTGKPITQSSTTLIMRAKIGMNAELTGSFSAPPQLDDNRAYDLARFQIIGFFYFLTYDALKNVGYWWRGGFYPIHGTIKSDWGNAVHRAFMKEVAQWEYRLILTTASGYYRAMIRRHPSEECWSWAIEWNDCYRLVGFFGDLSAAQEIANRIPGIAVQSIVESPNRWFRYKVDEPLPEHEDTLFHV